MNSGGLGQHFGGLTGPAEFRDLGFEQVLAGVVLGLDEETIKRCIANGCAKVNISTNLKHVFVESFTGFHRDNPKDFEPLHLIDAQYQACKALFKSKIAEFGGTGRAAEVLAKAA